MNIKNKKFSKVSAVSVITVLVLSLVLGLTEPNVAHAATTPSLGAAGTFGVLADTFTHNGSNTAVTGDVGYETSDGSSTFSATGSTYASPSAGFTNAGAAQVTALAALDTQTCTHTFPAGAVVLSTDTTHGSIGIYEPGVYCTAASSAASIGTGGITLSGAGTYIFRITGALTSVANSNVTLANSASSCDVFWTPTAATTLGANTTFKGTIIDNAGITVGSTTTWIGRALAFLGTVTTDADIITSTCATAGVAAGGPSGSVVQTSTLNVVKTVINDSGRTKIVADFPLFVTVAGIKIPVISGVTNTFTSPAPAYIVTETGDPNYTQTFSGDCDVNGRVVNNPGDHKFCIVTNNDIGAPLPVVPPLIDVVKVPSPLALPAGPGPVTYTYTLTNIGTVPVTDVTMVGDTCSPIVRVSGDTNSDNKLDVTETWVHRCTTTLSATHTNIVTTTGWANGISAVDIASATVIVGAPIVPPLIHVTKIPSPLALFSGGGMVTYTNKVTNPGTVALSNVRIADDKCSPVNYVSGDANSNLMLDATETWTYTCSSNLTQTTVNTVIATGDANGMTARDLAIVTVVVAAPALPATGVAPDENSAEKSTTGQEHWSNVSKVVQELRNFAGYDKNISQEVRQIAQDEEDSAKKSEEAMDKVEKVGKFRTVFIGTDYKNLGAIRSELVKTQNAIDRLTKTMERVTDINIKANLQKQIDALKAIQAKAQTFIKDHESQFSFLGWFVKLFNK